MDARDEFLEIFYDKIEREGSDKLLEWLEKSDFFVAPASSNRHSAYKGGLCRHSINVYKRFVKYLQAEWGDEWTKHVSPESVAIMGLLHDVCKVGTYVEDVKNVKIDGRWEQKPYYRIDDSLPYGHGEKSVYILSAFMKLTREEALAINWHMGEYDLRVKNGGGNAMADVFYKYPTTFLLHLSDLTATYLDETVEKF